MKRFLAPSLVALLLGGGTVFAQEANLPEFPTIPHDFVAPENLDTAEPVEVEIAEPVEVEIADPVEVEDPPATQLPPPVEPRTPALTLFSAPASEPARSEVPVGADGERVAPGSSIRALLDTLTALPPETLEGVERVPLARYLESLQFAGGGDPALKTALETYWGMARQRADYVYWTKRRNVLRELTRQAAGTDAQLLRTASAAAETNVACALVGLRASAVEVGYYGHFGRDVCAETQPHAGAYRTNFARSGSQDPRLAMLDRVVTLRGEQLSSAAAAYVSAESLLQQHLTRRSPLTTILQSMDEMNARRTAFFDILMDYNGEILDYVLSVSARRGADLTPLLSVTGVRVPTEDYVIPPARSGADLGTPGLHAPPAVAPPVVSPDPMPAPELEAEPSPDESEASPYGAALDENAVPEAPGGLETVPLTDSPAPGSEFTPIGGATGSSSTLPPIAPPPPGNAPSGDAGARNNSGAAIRPASDVYVVGYPPAGTTFARTGDPVVSVLVPGSGEAGNTQPGELRLADVLAQVPDHQRAAAVNAYWNYVTIQTQRAILRRQRSLLQPLEKRILADAANGAEDAAFWGILVEQAVFTLVAEQLELEISAWKTWRRLGTLLPDGVWTARALPTATSQPKSEGFALRLDRLQPGSTAHNHTLQRARYLEFCVSKLPEVYRQVEAVSELLMPGEKDVTANLAYGQLGGFCTALAQARELSAQYLRLVYAVNSTFTLCVFAGDTGALSPAQLEKTLAEDVI